MSRLIFSAALFLVAVNSVKLLDDSSSGVPAMPSASSEEYVVKGTQVIEEDSGYPPLTVNVDGVDKTLYVQYPYWSSATTSGADLTFDYNNRLYLSESDTLDRDSIYIVNLLGGVVDFDVDLSQVGCGCIAALYTVTMPAVDKTSDDFGYCDASQVGGHWCPEFDIMEANKYAFQVNPHTCDAPNANGVYDNCDRNGQCKMDVLTNALQNDFGPSSSNTIDTARPFHVKTEFHESGGQFIGYTSTLTQEGRELVLSSGQCDYLQNMTADMTRMSIVISHWASDSLNWLQKDSCTGSCSNTATVNSYSNLSIQTTGAGPINPPSPGFVPPTPAPEPTELAWGDDCTSLNDQLCGDSCAQCTYSWGVNDPGQWYGDTASCRCKVQQQDEEEERVEDAVEEQDDEDHEADSHDHDNNCCCHAMTMSCSNNCGCDDEQDGDSASQADVEVAQEVAQHAADSVTDDPAENAVIEGQIEQALVDEVGDLADVADEDLADVAQGIADGIATDQATQDVVNSLE